MKNFCVAVLFVLLRSSLWAIINAGSWGSNLAIELCANRLQALLVLCVCCQHGRGVESKRPQRLSREPYTEWRDVKRMVHLYIIQGVPKTDNLICLLLLSELWLSNVCFRELHNVFISLCNVITTDIEYVLKSKWINRKFDGIHRFLWRFIGQKWCFL